MSSTLTGTPADLIDYQNELVRTKKLRNLGRMYKIAIGPSANWNPPPLGQDPFIDRFGRLIDFRSRLQPVGASPDETMLLITAPFLHRDGTAGLPDVPDPNWKPGDWTPEETGYRVDGTPLNPKYPGQPAGWTPPKPGDPVRPRIEVNRDPAKDQAPMLKQRLEDRAECINGRVAELEGTHFLIFQPVLRIAYQPEAIVDGQPQLLAAVWTIECSFDPATQTDMALLVDPNTGEAHFYGGRYDIRVTE